MFFSSYDAVTNRHLLVEAGFELLVDEIVEIREPESPLAFQWIMARKPAGQAAPRGEKPRSTKDASARFGDLVRGR